MYKEFIKTFHFFEQLDLETVSILRNNLKLNTNYNLFKYNQDANEIYFINSGSVFVYDNDMNKIACVESNELLGYRDLKKYFEMKEKEIINKSKGGQIANLLGNVQTIDEDLDKDNNQNVNIIIKRKYQAIANDNTYYYVLKYDLINYIIENDPGFLNKLENYHEAQKSAIREVDLKITKELLENFDDDYRPGVICLSNTKEIIFENKLLTKLINDSSFTLYKKFIMS